MPPEFGHYAKGGYGRGPISRQLAGMAKWIAIPAVQQSHRRMTATDGVLPPCGRLPQAAQLVWDKRNCTTPRHGFPKKAGKDSLQALVLGAVLMESDPDALLSAEKSCAADHARTDQAAGAHPAGVARRATALAWALCGALGIQPWRVTASAAPARAAPPARPGRKMT